MGYRGRNGKGNKDKEEDKQLQDDKEDCNLQYGHFGSGNRKKTLVKVWEKEVHFFRVTQSYLEHVAGGKMGRRRP